MSEEWTGESLLELSRSYQQSQALLAAAELNLFEVLERAAGTASEIAQALGTDARATEILLNALAAQGILCKAQHRFSIVPAARPLLLPDGESSVLAMIRHQTTCAHRWNRLAEVVRSGRPSSVGTGPQWTDQECRAFIEAMHVVGRELAGMLVPHLEPARFRRALDLGGGSGTYAVALLRAAPALRVTLFDLPPVIELARARLERTGLAERVELVAGDFETDPLPAGHDLVLLSAIIHQNSPAQNRELYTKCFAVLEPGGALVIREIVMDATHTEPPAGALFAINMLVSTAGGATYSVAEIRAELESAGFANVELLHRGTWMDSLVRAWRPT